MRKTREEKAITLIALIITIVVLLILAVVAINAVTGDGIIQHAVNAKEDYEKAQDEEQDMIAYYEQYLQTEGKSGEWLQDKTIVKNVKTGQVIGVGEKVKNYTANTKDWYVLGAENGCLLLTTNTNITTVTLQGSTAGWSSKEYRFVGAENALHNACKENITELGAATSVRSIKVEDINRITGYNPVTDNSAYGRKVTYTAVKDGEGKVTGMTASYITADGQLGTLNLESNSFIHPDGRIIITDVEWDARADKTGLTRVDSIEIMNNSTSYVAGGYLQDSEEVLSLLISGEDYFLSSTNVSTHTDGHTTFYLLYMWIGEQAVAVSTFWKSDKESTKDNQRTKGVRPVVYMSADFEPQVD